VEWTKRFSFADRNLAASQSAAFFTLPKGFVHERTDAVLRTAEGAAGTFDVGIDGNLQLFAAGLDANGTPNARIASVSGVAVAAADADATYGAEEATLINEIKADVNQLVGDVNKAGYYCHTDTVAAISVPSGQPTLDAAVVDVTFVGYMTDTA
jgi:hypothetical protein